MAVTAKMVKELREMTGAGMMDCKKALNETNGDMDAAIEFLRKNGEAKAVKKAGRIAAEGIVMADVKDDKTAAIVEVNSETDFVAKNAEFQGFVKAVVNQAIASDSADMDAAENADIVPDVAPIRGGTDGARLSFKGLPCPNLGTGGYAFHGVYEHITVEGMDKVVVMVKDIVGMFAK